MADAPSLALPPPTPAVETWLPGFVAAETQPAMIEQWVDRTTSAIVAALPATRKDAGLADVVRRAVREQWLAFLAAFAQPDPAFHLVDGARKMAAAVAERQLPLATLIDVYRVAQQSSWVYVTGVVSALPRDRPDDQTEILIYFWSRAGAWIDASIGESIDVYQAERDRISRGTAARQFDVVRDLLAGEADDLRWASAALGGYPFSSFHTALVLHAHDEQAVAALDDLAARAAKALGAPRPLAVHPGGGQLWCWAATSSPPADDALDALAGELAGANVSAGAGTPGEGLDGFVVSHEEAVAAHRVGRRGDGGPALTSYASVELLVLLGDSEAADRFVARQLGDLARDDAGAQRLRETLEAYLDHGGSIDATATALSVHPNTVRYRIGQAAEALGRPAGRYDGDLAVALRHLRVFGGSARGGEA